MISLDRPVIVGRDGDLTIEDSTVSRHHLQVTPGDNAPSLVDLDSASGTALNDVQVGRATLTAGDSLVVGKTELKVLRLVRYSDAAAGHALLVRHDGKSRAVALHDNMTIGRESGSDISIVDATVSRRHAVIRIDSQGVSIEDLDSANGTRVDGDLVRRPRRLGEGSEITVGNSSAQLTFSAAPVPAPITLRVTVEGNVTEDTLEVAAEARATVAQVTAELGRALGESDRQLVLYSPRDGVLFHPDDLWHSVGVCTGDQLVLGAGDATSFKASQGRLWPKRRTLRLNQLPRTVWPPGEHNVEVIEVPEGTSFRGRGVIWQIAGGFGAVLIGLALAIVNPDYMIFGLITGGIGIVSIAASILGDQSRRRFKAKEFQRRLGELDRELAEVRVTQAESLRALSPSVEEIEAWVQDASPRLWERRPEHSDALHLRIGTGRRLARLHFERTRGDDPSMLDQLEQIKSAHQFIEPAPVTIPGNELGSFGIAGAPARTRTLIQRMVVEAAAQHAPDQLSIWVAATDRSWDWSRWLPHVSAANVSGDPSQATEVLSAASRSAADLTNEADGRLHLVVIPDSEVRFDLTKLISATRGRGLIIVAAPQSRLLPNGLASVLSISVDDRASLSGSFDDGPVGDFAVDRLEDKDAERIAIEMSRVGGSSTRTVSSGLVELLGLGSVATLDVASAWSKPASPLTVPVGLDDSGEPVSVGLRSDGPHAMIAGTTGSGKSELLQTILAGEVLRHRPENLNLFLIDFKGGATFSPFARLPHVVGVVTDLEHDSSLAGRAFTSLDSEIARRKQLLDDAGVPDIKALERSLPDGAARLANLVVVIDEFALLVERQPEVKERLDTIATQGRSLGIHMILATQSPSGVITHAIRTNTNLWICLRVVTDSESVEILGSRAAARISDRTPGRALLRLGAGTELREFQAARIGRSVVAEDSSVSVTRLDSATDAPLAQRPASLITELSLVIDKVIETAEALRCNKPEPLWLDPLPNQLDADTFYNRFEDAAVDHDDTLRVAVGLTDDPSRHAQYPHVIDLSRSGHLLVVGVYGSGKSTTLRQGALDLAKRRSPGDVHIYGIDGGAGSLRDLTELPHVGDVVAATDAERLSRLIDRLTAVVAERRESTEIIDRGGFLQARCELQLPWLVLLVDDFAMFREAAEGIDNGRLLERFNSLLQSGPTVGLHVLITGSQAVDMRTRELNLLHSKLILQSADPSDYTLADPRFNPSHKPMPLPGRGIVAGLLEVQVALPSDDAVSQIASKWHAVDTSGTLPRPIRRLPKLVSTEEVAHEGPGIPLGLGGAEVETVSIELSATSPILLVAGPRQSGRTSALAYLREELIKSRRTRSLVLAPRSGSWDHLTHEAGSAEGAAHEIVRDPEQFAEALDRFVGCGERGAVLFIDDAESLSGFPGLADRLDRLVRRASETDTWVVIGARVNDLPGMFDPWARYAVSLRRALLLAPTADDLFLFGQKLTNAPKDSTVGRGVLVDGSAATVLQVVQR